MMRCAKSGRFSGWWLLVVLSWCLLPTLAQAENASITLQLKWKHQFQFAGFYMALEKGYYREAGLDVTLLEGGPGKSPVAHVVQGQGAYGVSSTGALIERSHGKPVRVLGAIFQHSPLVLLVKRDSGIKTWSDLRGKRIMLQRGYQNASIVAALKDIGISDKDFIRQDSSYDIQDLIAGRTDAFDAYVTNEPHQMKLLGVPFRILYPTDRGVDFYGDIVITSDAEIRHHPQRARALMEATSRGWNDALEHMDEAIDLILLEYNTQHLSRQHLLFEARELAGLMMQDVVHIGYMNRYRWQRIAGVYEDQGLLAANYSLADFLYQPEPTVMEWVQGNRWWIALAVGLFLLGLLGLHIAMLRYTVRQRTQALEKEQQILRAAEAKYEDLYNNAPDMYVSVDSETVIILQCNQTLATNLGYGKEEIVGRSIFDLYQPQCYERLRAVHHTFRDIGEVHDVELQLKCKDGSAIDVMLNATAVRDASGKVVRSRSCWRDISERKAQERERAKLQAQVEHMQRLESLGVLAGGIAHDFNNILTAILGNAAMAERKVLTSPQDTPRYLTNIVESSEKAAELCKQMLAYSGKGKFVIQAINLSTMVEEVSRLLQVSIAKSVVLKYHLAENLPAVEADAAQLQQVMMNLVINANEAIGNRSGVITLTTGVMEADRSYLADSCLDDALPDGHYVYLEVSDTGCGMDKATQAKLFDPFFTTKATGNGLGMAAVLGIVRGHHGALKLDSEPGRGTTFKMLLPASDQLPQVRAASVASGDDGCGTGTVLIVDDEETIREAAAMMLEDMGFTTLTAVDGVDGVETYRQHQKEIVAVLMDMTMPRMDGKECFTELRRINENVRVVLSSGYSEQEMTSEFAGQGLAGFLHKPYFPDDLQAKIREVLDG